MGPFQATARDSSPLNHRVSLLEESLGSHGILALHRPSCPALLARLDSVKQWWFTVGHSSVPKKGTRSLLLLVVWQIWLERNARIFQRRERSAPDLIANIKAEARLWGLA
ncbi:hypothetical protein U9M48_027421, partial [Paspalum notatum var. saurae]